MKIVLISNCSLDIEQYVEFKISILISPSKSLISSRWVTYIIYQEYELKRVPYKSSPSRCTLAKATDQHHERSPLRGSLLAASAARFVPSALKVRSFWMDYTKEN